MESGVFADNVTGNGPDDCRGIAVAFGVSFRMPAVMPVGKLGYLVVAAIAVRTCFGNRRAEESQTEEAG